MAEIRESTLNEKGSVTLLVAMSMFLLLALIPALLDMGAVVTARAQAQNAADAAALAAAQELVTGGDPTNAAHVYASRNDAIVTGVEVSGDSVTVTTSKECRLLWSGRLGIMVGPVRGKGKAELKDFNDPDY